MKKTIDKHGFKITVATSVIVIIFIIMTTMQTATWKANMEAECDANLIQIDMMKTQQLLDKTHITTLEQKTNSMDVKLAEINVKLANIEGMLLEIKMDLKTK